MKIGSSMAEVSVDRPKTITVIMVVSTLVLAILAGVPSLWPRTFDFLHSVTVNTDPEDMLAEDEPVRVFHNNMKDKMALHDMVVVGVVNEENPDGVFNPTSLHRVYHLTQYTKTFRWPDSEDPRKKAGVILQDMIAPSTVDNIEQGGLGTVRFEWLMPSPPMTKEEALAVRDKAQDIPFLDGTLVSEDGKAAAIYLPITDKGVSSRMYKDLNQQIPVLWLYAPLMQNMKGMEVSEGQQKALDAVEDLGRVAAYESAGRKQFQDLMNELAEQVSQSDPAAGWDATLQTLKSWSETASELDKNLDADLENLQSRADEASGEAKEKLQKEIARQKNYASRDANDTLQQHLSTAIQKTDDDLWLRLTRFYVETRRNNVARAVELLESVQDFASQSQSGLAAASGGLSGLPQVVQKTFSSNPDFPGADEYHIAGLPVAEDQFGVEMFWQMAISAPLAMLLIFVLLLVFFRKLVLIIAPMIVAMVSVIVTMSLLVAMGYTVHIMSSMIPIFIMPIAVLDTVHILSEFYDRYQETQNRRQALLNVMQTLFTPMLYTSLTTSAGFASLALTPIPPVQVFGLFVAFGVMMAWLWTVTFVPAYVMFIPEKSLENFGLEAGHEEEEIQRSWMGRMLQAVGKRTFAYAGLIVVATLLVTHVAEYGILSIKINDNPTKWFTESHPIRVADNVLNEHFGGTYMAYLSMEAPDESTGEYSDKLAGELASAAEKQGEDSAATAEVLRTVESRVRSETEGAESPDALLDSVQSFVSDRMQEAPDDKYEAWRQAQKVLDEAQGERQVFKHPEVLRYIEGLQKQLRLTGVVGKSNSLTDIVKTVYRELMAEAEGREKAFRVPDSRQAVAQCLVQYENSHRPQDLTHFVTRSGAGKYRTGTIWVQLKSGDNRDMSQVVEEMKEYVKINPPPTELEFDWFGLTYINVVWQQKMVSGMLKAFLGSFLVVLLLMTLLFGSGLWGLLCMVPLTVTIVLIYGAIGLVGKAYDMPVAVLSSLSLGLAVDYAIHFLARSRQMYNEYGSWSAAVGPVFGEPARAITRNVIVIGTGFLPLLAAPLVPYKTVGTFIAAILLTAGVASLLLLPAMIRLLEGWLFPSTEQRAFGCKCGTCALAGTAAVALVAVNVNQFLNVGWTWLTVASIVALAVLLSTCGLLCRREKCGLPASEEQESEEKEESEQTEEQKEKSNEDA